MSAIKLRKELQKYIEIGDRDFLNVLHETAIAYIAQKELDKMIAEGEDDIEAGRIHSQDEVQKMIEDWTTK